MPLLPLSEDIHSKPSPSGAGLVHPRDLLRFPVPPHVKLQGIQLPHVLHFPSTKKYTKTTKFAVDKMYTSYIVKTRVLYDTTLYGRLPYMVG